MPMKTRRHKRAKCDHGLCHLHHSAEHHFLVDLHDGKPPIKISACTADHLEQLRKGWRKYVVT